MYDRILLNFYSVTNITFHVEFQIILWQSKTKKSWIEYYRKGFQRSCDKMLNLTLSSLNSNKRWLETMTSVCASLLVSFNLVHFSVEVTVCNRLCIMHVYDFFMIHTPIFACIKNNAKQTLLSTVKYLKCLVVITDHSKLTSLNNKSFKLH